MLPLAKRYVKGNRENMRVKVEKQIDVNTKIQSSIREKTEAVMWEKGWKARPTFGPFVQYVCVVYEEDPYYQKIEELEKENREIERRNEETGINIWTVRSYPEYTKEEKREAIGYTICDVGNARCEVTVWDEYYLSLCDNCKQFFQKAPYIFVRSKKLKRLSEEKRVFADESFLSMFVTIPMWEYLLENGISGKGFLPAYYGKRNKELAGYQMIGSNLLERGSCRCMFFGDVRKCEVCGRTSAYYSGRSVFQNTYIDSEKVRRWDDINAVYEYCGGRRMVVLSLKMHKLLTDADPKVRMIPVFPKEMKERLDGGRKHIISDPE